jgi:hypothetical protein
MVIIQSLAQTIHADMNSDLDRRKLSSKLPKAVIKELRDRGYTKVLKPVPLDCLPDCPGGLKKISCVFLDFVILPSERVFCDFLII